MTELRMFSYNFAYTIYCIKGNLRSKKELSSNERAWKMQKRAITDLNAPNGSRDIPFQSQEFEQYGRRHFVDF